MKLPRRGEVWLVDLGLAAKVRPCLVLSVPAGESDRVLATLVPHTTSLRGSRYEVSVPAPFLKPGAFDVQGLVTVPHAYLIRVIGELSSQQLATIEEGVAAWLGLKTVKPPGGLTSGSRR